MKLQKFSEVAKEHEQCWAQDSTGKWLVYTGLDTVCMEIFVKERKDWPAIPIFHPEHTRDSETIAKGIAGLTLMANFLT